MNAPQVQAITGFLATAGEQILADVTLSSNMEYGTIWVVSLDDQPLSVSQKMLLLVMSEDKTNGWQVESLDQYTYSEEGVEHTIDDAYRIKDLGTTPFLVKNLSGSVTFNRSDAHELKVIPLDSYGYPKGAEFSGISIEIQPTTAYYLIER